MGRWKEMHLFSFNPLLEGWMDMDGWKVEGWPCHTQQPHTLKKTNKKKAKSMSYFLGGLDHAEQQHPTPTNQLTKT
jgi:hypothetical protein